MMKTLSLLALNQLQLALQIQPERMEQFLPMSHYERALQCSNDFQLLSECFVAMHVLKLWKRAA